MAGGRACAGRRRRRRLCLLALCACWAGNAVRVSGTHVLAMERRVTASDRAAYPTPSDPRAAKLQASVNAAIAAGAAAFDIPAG